MTRHQVRKKAFVIRDDWHLCRVPRVVGIPRTLPKFPKVPHYPLHRILRYVYGVLNVDEKKLIGQFGWKLRDERFKPN